MRIDLCRIAFLSGALRLLRSAHLGTGAFLCVFRYLLRRFDGCAQGVSLSAGVYHDPARLGVCCAEFALTHDHTLNDALLRRLWLFFVLLRLPNLFEQAIQEQIHVQIDMNLGRGRQCLTFRFLKKRQRHRPVEAGGTAVAAGDLLDEQLRK